MNSDFIVAVHALVFLNHNQGIVSSEMLADNVCTNAARIRKIMAPLKRAGLVEGREGNEGGYRFTADACATSLAAVADALGVRFVEARWHSGSADKKCLVASGMAGIMDDIFADLDAGVRDRLAGITIASIDERIFAR
ncbi:RrF2 family transcriptional regulator [Arabiibacter massiliensis]|uniref:RrF2 family transcriptional regulator n=1 Tax=Arabiibacter massiliensis TaxID=1870985 RepID=UPI0009B941B4|nr:Rrf2 family transcriptional regulator [Arabiibacter massiliensis]